MEEAADKILASFDALSGHLESQGQAQEGVRLLRTLVGQITHDLRTPIAVFSLELFSAEYLLSAATTAAAALDSEKLADALASLAEIAVNLTQAQATAQRLIETLDARNTQLAAAKNDEA